MTDNIVLQCPECKKPVHWNDKFPHRPFCSARCQQLDFGDWANEAIRIPGPAITDPSIIDTSRDENQAEDFESDH